MDVARDYQSLSELELATLAYARDPQVIGALTTRNNQAPLSRRPERAPSRKRANEAHKRLLAEADFAQIDARNLWACPADRWNFQMLRAELGESDRSGRSPACQKIFAPSSCCAILKR